MVEKILLKTIFDAKFNCWKISDRKFSWKFFDVHFWLKFFDRIFDGIFCISNRIFDKFWVMFSVASLVVFFNFLYFILFYIYCKLYFYFFKYLYFIFKTNYFPTIFLVTPPANFSTTFFDNFSIFFAFKKKNNVNSQKRVKYFA